VQATAKAGDGLLSFTISPFCQAPLPMEPAASGKGSTPGPDDLRGPSTRAVHAGLPGAEQGEPFLPPPVLAAPFHLAGPADASPYAYARYANPTWTHLERALGDLEGGEALVFGSGMAAMTAVLLTKLRAGDVLVAPGDGYPGVRSLAREQLEPRGVEVRLVPSDTGAMSAACAGATLVFLETPSNPRLDVVDIAAMARAAHAAGALVAVDNSLATPLGQRPLAHGADLSVTAGTKALSGHADVLFGVVAARDAGLLEDVLAWRGMTGSILGPFEAWLAHRSLPTLDLRLARQSTNAQAVADLLRGRDDVVDVRHPSGDPVAARQMERLGPLVCFDLGSARRAQAFLSACELVSEATSFGGVHTTAERRGRWGTDDVSEGFIRFSAGIEDTDDLVADVARALDST
jgi:cystathionine gamma-lyase